MKASMLLAVFVLGGPYMLRGADVDIVDAWQRRTAVGTLAEVAAALESRSAVWPHVRSPAAVSSTQLSPAEVLRRNSLVRSLHEKIVECEMKESARLIDVEGIETYRRIRDAVSGPGGYANYVLADAVDRLAVSRICGFLVSNTARWADVENMRTALAPRRFADRNLVALFEEEKGTNQWTMSAAEGEQLESWLKVLGTDEARLLLAPESSATCVSSLIENPNLARLVLGMANMELLVHVRLPALVEFLRRGGRLDELRSDDMRRFQEVMGSSSSQFKSGLLNVRRVYPSDLKAVLNEFGAGLDKSATYRQALK